METKETMSIKGEYMYLSVPEEYKRDSLLVRLLSKCRTPEQFEEVATRFGMPFKPQFDTNLITLASRSLVAGFLMDEAVDGRIGWGALGSGSTAFTEDSTQLNTEVFRIESVSKSRDDNEMYFSWYIESGDVSDQTFLEFASFIGGTATANSGTPFSMLIPDGGWVKNGGMFISARYTIN